MKRSRLALALGLCGLLAVAPVTAFDRVVHYDVVYTVAVANGFTPQEASLIARSSQALDDNTDASAFEWGLIGRELKEVAKGRNPAELDHEKAGQAFHALTKYRALVEGKQLERIQGADADRVRQLVYLGQYLHMVADEVVHPEDPLAGHFLEGKEPDRADLDRDKLRITIGLLNQKLSAFQQQGSGGLDVTTEQQLVRTPERLNDDPRTNLVLERVVKAVNESWTRTYVLPDPKDFDRSVQGSVGAANYVADDFLDRYEKVRQARATEEISRELRNNGLAYTFYKPAPRDKIVLDRNGEPIGGPALDGQSFTPPESPSTAPGFSESLAVDPQLQREREDAVGLTAARAAGIAALDAASPWKIVQDQSDEQRQAAATWLPPSSPGGVALNPRLDVPLAELGTPQAIELDGRRLVLRTDRGRYAFAGVSPQGFATLARTIADGQTPFLSIGSEPSNRAGYARVSLSPSLRDTREGLALYLADIQFKTIFARLPLAPPVRRMGLEELTAAFPGNGGDFVRFWITSGDVRLELRDGELVTADHGMRINSETRLNNSVARDPAMEAYVDNLTAHWDEMAKALPPFREVQSMALATAIVFWARDHHVPVDPFILALPSRDAMTPTYAPVVAAYDHGMQIAGGVSLAPEDRAGEAGQRFLLPIRAHLSRLQAGDAALARGLLAVEGLFKLFLVCVLPALLLWCLLGLRKSGLSLFRTLLLWSGVGLAQLLVFALMQPLVMGEALAYFDRDLLAMLSSFVFFPMLLFSVLARARQAPVAGNWRRRGVLLLGLSGPAWMAFAGLGLAELTVAVSGPVPGRTLNRVLTLEVAPPGIVVSSLVSQWTTPEGMTLLPAPRSLFENMRPPFVLMHAHEPEGDTLQMEDGDKMLPAGELRRVQWPQDWGVPADARYYTADGNPPL